MSYQADFKTDGKINNSLTVPALWESKQGIQDWVNKCILWESTKRQVFKPIQYKLNLEVFS